MSNPQPLFDSAQAHSRLLDRHIPLIPPGPVLDLGCGAGHDAAYLAGRGFNVTALDRNPAALAAVQERREVHPAGRRIRLLDLDLSRSLPDAEAQSAILALNVLHFLRPRRAVAVIRHCQRSLKPGGLLFVRLFAARNGGEFDFLPTPDGFIRLFETTELREFHYYSKSDERPQPHTHWIIDAVAVKAGTAGSPT